ncbi:ABC transporter ATP-binding protein [Clostridium sp.]|uniref:ABC transporter ATP-binding protein n=1 Tax=Clostridium sp. TaxID=1506 RepID=UPI002FCA17A2
MDNIVQIENVSKKFITKRALNGVSLTLEKGKVLGVLGPNGSGKTTLLKILAGLTKATSGNVKIDSKDLGIQSKSVVSYMPDRNYFYKWMRVKDAIELFKDFYFDFDESKCLALLNKMSIPMEEKITALSKGMHEKLNIALVLSRKAKLFILDEPLGGVDPVAREQILDMILDNLDGDSSMIITTHLVRDMERLFDEVIYLREGDVFLKGNAEELRASHGKTIDDLYREIFGV